MASLSSPLEALVQGEQVQACRESKRLYWGYQREEFGQACRKLWPLCGSTSIDQRPDIGFEPGVRSSSQKGELVEEWRKEMMNRSSWALLKLFFSTDVTAGASKSRNSCFTSAFQILHKFLFCEHCSGDVRATGFWEMQFHTPQAGRAQSCPAPEKASSPVVHSFIHSFTQATKTCASYILGTYPAELKTVLMELKEQRVGETDLTTFQTLKYLLYKHHSIVMERRWACGRNDRGRAIQIRWSENTFPRNDISAET